MGPRHLLHVVQQHVHCLHVQVELLVDCEGLLEKLVLVAQSELGDVRAVEVVEAVDVVEHLGAIALDGSDDQQVL